MSRAVAAEGCSLARQQPAGKKISKTINRRSGRGRGGFMPTPWCSSSVVGAEVGLGEARNMVGPTGSLPWFPMLVRHGVKLGLERFILHVRGRTFGLGDDWPGARTWPPRLLPGSRTGARWVSHLVGSQGALLIEQSKGRELRLPWSTTGWFPYLTCSWAEDDGRWRHR